MMKKNIAFLLVLLVFIGSCPLITQAAEEYEARDPFYSMTDPNVNRATSTHFQLIWGKRDQTGKVNDTFIQGNLKNLENMWECYVNSLGFSEPGISVYPANRGKKYKTNVYITRTGLSQHEEGWAYMSGDRDGFGYIITDPDAMRVAPPTWVLPHEFGHVVTMHQLGWNDNSYTSAWWETIANWFREQYLYSSYYQYNGTVYAPDTGSVDPFYTTLSLCSPHGRNYYDAWMILQYLHENPDNYPYFGKDFIKKLMQEALPNEYPYDTIKRLAPNVSFKDVLGDFAKRIATQDFKQKDLYRKKFNQLTAVDYNKQLVFTHLRKVSDKPNWWRVPIERAPQQTGINIFSLVPQGTGNGRKVTVTFNGLKDTSRGSDWRACIVVQDNNGNTRYSTLWNSGSNSVILSNNENTVYLVVTATPDDVLATSAFSDEEQEPYASAPTKVRMPYEVQITGAAPAEEKYNTSGQWGHSHSNGGGFVANSATVASTAFVGPNAVVLGRAQVLDNARIEDNAVVQDNAVVSGNAIVSGHALVKENAVVKDNAKVRDFAIMMGATQASGNARVLESSRLSENRKVTDYGVIKGLAWAYGDGIVSGEGIIDGDYADSTNVTKGTVFGWLRGQDYANARPHMPSLYAGYEFNTDNNAFVFEKYGATNGILRGNPTWVSNLQGHQGVLQFNGSNQYVTLENSVSDLKDIEVRSTVFWKGGNQNQRIFNFGSSADKYMYLTPSDENGKVKFVIKNGSNVQTLVGDKSIPVEKWTNVRVVLSGNTGKLYIDNNVVAENQNMTINPEDLNAPNTNTESNCNYIGRGISSNDPYYQGEIDSFYVFFKEGQAPDIPVNDLKNIALYKFDERDGTQAQDSTGISGNSTLVDGASFIAGKINNAVDLNGSNGYVKLPDGVVSKLSDMTIATWVKLDSINTWQRIFDFGSNTDINMFLTPKSGDGNLRFAIKNSGSEQQINASTPLGTGQWIHVAVTISGNTGILYVNGVQAASSSISITPSMLGNTRNNYIGKSQYNDPYLDGQIDDFRIYNYALSSQEIAQLSKSTSTDKKGDLNNDSEINSLDYVLMKKYLMEQTVTINKNAADLNNDALINSLDLALLKQMLL